MDLGRVLGHVQVYMNKRTKDMKCRALEIFAGHDVLLKYIL